MIALASDFDGTLYFGRDGFKGKDLESIQEFQKKGNLFGVCTGRPFQGIQYACRDVLKNNELAYDFYIVSTGAMILDKNYRVLFEKYISNAVAAQIVNTYKDAFQVYVHVGIEDIYTFGQQGGFQIPQNVVNNFEDIKSDCILGVSIECKKEEIAQKLYKELLSKYEKDLNIFVNKSDIDMVAKGVSKGNACKQLKELFELEKVCGIGDNYNDVPMLKSTDYSFTFTYSPKEVQTQANEVVSSLSSAIVNLI